MPREVLRDADGENFAVRYFLAQYSGGGKQTIGNMMQHLDYCGFPYWPAKMEQYDKDSHMTKGDAQDWLRHLFSLENEL